MNSIHFVFLVVLLPLVSSQSQGRCNPTPMSFPMLFQNGCTELNRSSEECNDIWTDFSSTFANQDPTTYTISTTNYEIYFDMFPIRAMRNTFLFWSQTIELTAMLSCMCETADVFAGPNYFPIAIMDKIAETLEMPMSDLRWCGTTEGGTGGIQYTGQCPCSTSYSFFEEFSTRFGRAAEGTIFYLGYGESVRGAFPEDSFFALFEIDALNTMEVDRAVILVMHNANVTSGVSEKCGEGSLHKLRWKIEERDIDYTCYDVYGYPVNTDPSLVELTKCAANIITAEQQNKQPIENRCFEKEKSCSEQNGTDPCNAGLSTRQQDYSSLTLFSVVMLLSMVSFT